jgi:hypothetical protein
VTNPSLSLEAREFDEPETGSTPTQFEWNHDNEEEGGNGHQIGEGW